MNRLSNFYVVMLLVILICGCTSNKPGQDSRLAPNAKYVAMGSSFAAGPGITKTVENSPRRCGRSQDNYAQQLARRLDLHLTDVSCSGAKTQDILSPSKELPAQIEAVDTDTALVTITIGGNDLGYIGGLMVASCEEYQKIYPASENQKCWTPPKPPTEEDYESTEMRMNEIAGNIKAKAPEAILVFVDYVTVLPEKGMCKVTPLERGSAETAREIAADLEELTERVARNNNALIFKASELTRSNHACAEEAWMRGYPDAKWDFASIPYHPTLDGMTAIADGLEEMLK